MSSPDDSEKLLSNLEAECVFGEVSVLCGIPQPYTVRVTELCRLLRIDKDSFFNIMEIYFTDGRQVLNNLLKVFDLVTDYICHISETKCIFAIIFANNI